MALPRIALALLLTALGCGSADDADGDGYDAAIDCDDLDPQVHPGSVEICNEVDDNCNGSIDEAAVDAPAWFPDDDQDGHGNDKGSVWGCAPPADHVARSNDCDDTDAKRFPGAPELCDGVDNDCDKDVDEGGVCGELQCDDGLDDDGDGLVDCADPDCDGGCAEVCHDQRDNDGDGHTDCADEACWHDPGCVETNCQDGVDDEQDGLIDCDDPDCWADGCGDVLYRAVSGTVAVSRETTTWRERDCDGQDCASGVERSQNVQLYDITGELSVHDDDGRRTCVWSYDEGDLSETFVDGESVASRTRRAGFTIEPGCGPADARFLPDRLIYSEQSLTTVRGETWLDGYFFEVQRRTSDLEHPERAGDVVRDLAFIDPIEPSPPIGHCASAQVWQSWPDLDGDGFGAMGPGTVTCSPPTEGVQNGLDCDDATPEVHPDAVETCGDGVDNDCDGTANCPGLAGNQSVKDLPLIYEGAAQDGARRLSAVGDLNGDGRRDLAIAAPFDDTAGDDAGSVYLTLGPGQEPAAVWTGEWPDDLAGASVSDAGDHDGDGVSDILIGATGVVVDGKPRSGAVYLLTDPLAGGSLADADARIWATGAWLGTRVDHVGDLDGDGWSDVAVGAQTTAVHGANSGGVYVIRGPLRGDVALTDAAWALHGAHRHDLVGDALAGVGDVNGDGTDDLLIGHRKSSLGTSEAGAAHLFLSPLPTTATVEDADATWTGVLSSAWAGEWVGPAGDMNDDGYADMLVAAPRSWGLTPRRSAVSGAIYVVTGSANPVDASLADAHATVHARRIYDAAGVAVAGGQDIDGDGVPDLIIGAPGDDSGAPNAGSVAVFLGPIEGRLHMDDATATYHGALAQQQLGASVALVGDHTGDARSEIAVASVGLEDQGQVWMLLSGPGW